MTGEGDDLPRRHERNNDVIVRVAAVLVALVMAVLASVPVLAAPTFPSLTGQIVDNANLLTPEDRAAVEGELKALEEKSTDQFVVVTVPSLDGYEIEDYGYQLGRHWGIGQSGKDNGVMLIVAPNERKVRIEVGRGLEPIVTDLMSRIIIENAILPGVPARQFQRRHPGRRARHQGHAARRRGSRQRARARTERQRRAGLDRTSHDRVLDRGRRLHHLRADALCRAIRRRPSAAISGGAAGVEALPSSSRAARPTRGAVDGPAEAEAGGLAAAEISAAAADPAAGNLIDGALNGSTGTKPCD